MTDKAKTKTILSLICNCVIFLVTTGVFISYFFVKSRVIENGWQSLRFFTTDSNLLTAVAAALVAVCDVHHTLLIKLGVIRYILIITSNQLKMAK